jgi:enoyl-CoA hydratase
MHHELEQVFADVAADDGIGAILLTGAGKAFCVGGDIKEMDSGELTGSRELITTGALNLVRNLVSVPQPIVVAVNGDAIGLGATLALLGDIVLASEVARFGDPHVKVGLVAGDGGAVIWPLLVGLNRAKEYLMTGDLIPAAEAERIGLVNHVYPAAELEGKAVELASRLADGPAHAIRWTKQAVNKALRAQTELILDTSLALEAVSASLPDHAEGVRAFVERRKPRFNATK